MKRNASGSAGVERRRKKSGKANVSAYLFLAPATILSLVFIIIPLVMTFRYSVTDWSGLGEYHNIGLANFKNLASDSFFWESVKNTFIWAALYVLFLPVTGLVLAIVLEYALPFQKMKSAVRTIFFMPMMMSLVAIALLWQLIYNPNLGILPKLLVLLGVVKGPVDLLASYKFSLFTAFIPIVWQTSGFGMVIYSAAIQGIPSDILEAAAIDGCTKWKSIRYIVIPMLTPTIALLATLNLVNGFKGFDLLYVLTGGGPGTSTQVTSLYIFKQAFVSNHYGYSAAMSLILFLITVFFGKLFLKFSNRLENYV